MTNQAGSHSDRVEEALNAPDLLTPTDVGASYLRTQVQNWGRRHLRGRENQNVGQGTCDEAFHRFKQIKGEQLTWRSKAVAENLFERVWAKWREKISNHPSNLQEYRQGSSLSVRDVRHRSGRHSSIVCSLLQTDECGAVDLLDQGSSDDAVKVIVAELILKCVNLVTEAFLAIFKVTKRAFLRSMFGPVWATYSLRLLLMSWIESS
ncbi:hypothetical protein F7725_000005 [Dissostichus mawsoni]|uniref:Uncharacterized protein n=1 Tax=Dissostichus mawsoni TaxID=36200 RepID=A0A7J5ZJV0_DISMA|nr:hypothetical protein F7725_000005 [Dissostichus mawsoni]